jgi:hypothetical protein
MIKEDKELRERIERIEKTRQEMTRMEEDCEKE